MQIGNITALGIGSGMDVNSIISKLIAVDKQPIDIKQADVTLLKAYESDYTQLGKYVSTLLQDTNNMVNDLNTQSASINDQSIASVSVSGTPSTATHTIDVTSLAQGQTWVSTNSFSSQTSSVASSNGVFSFSVGSNSYSINVNNSTSLSDFTQAVNNTNSGLTATLVYNGSEYNIVLNTPSGTNNDLTINTNDTNIQFPTTPNVSSQNAQLTLDGVSVTSQTNDLNNYIEGLNIHLIGTGSTTINVNVNTDSLTSSMKNIVDDYNAIINYINQNSSYDNQKDVANAFFGSVTVEGIENSIKSVLLNSFNTNGSIRYLSDLGITFNDNGQLEFNSTTFQGAISTNLKDVINFLHGVQSSSGSGLLNNLQNTLNNITSANGPLASQQQQLQNNIDNLNNQIGQMNKQIQQEKDMLTLTFAQMDQYIGVLQNESNYMTQVFNSSVKNK